MVQVVNSRPQPEVVEASRQTKRLWGILGNILILIHGCNFDQPIDMLVPKCNWATLKSYLDCQILDLIPRLRYGHSMRNWFIRLVLIVLCTMVFPFNSPAPLTYRADEGWTYEPVGGGKWRRTRAKDQLEVAQNAFDKKDYGLALKAARRTVKTWPLSDHAPKAQYLMGRCYEAQKQDERAFQQYQKLLEKYPKIDNYSEVLDRQYAIASRFLAGEWFKLWGYIPFFPTWINRGYV
jgi:tetratricopeptide (TPR) repeat protein